MITDLIGELRGFDAAADEKGFLGFFRKKSAKVSALKAKYDKAEVNVERIAGELEKHQITLLKDVSMLDKMYEENLLYFKQLTMYILAGKKKLETERAATLPALVRKAEQSGLPEDAQKARDFADMCTRFEKKIYDLELTRNISIQMAPQIRLIQNNDTMMVEKIQTTIVNTIPLWKSQMVIALGLEHSRQAVEAQRAVTNMTNELLKKNAELLHSSTVAVAEESERGIVDIETLTEPFNELLDKTVMNNISLRCLQVTLSFPYIVWNVVTVYSDSQVILGYPKVRKNNVFIVLIKRRKNKHECRNIRG